MSARRDRSFTARVISVEQFVDAVGGHSIRAEMPCPSGQCTDARMEHTISVFQQQCGLGLTTAVWLCGPGSKLDAQTRRHTKAMR